MQLRILFRARVLLLPRTNHNLPGMSFGGWKEKSSDGHHTKRGGTFFLILSHQAVSHETMRRQKRFGRRKETDGTGSVGGLTRRLGLTCTAGFASCSTSPVLIDARRLTMTRELCGQSRIIGRDAVKRGATIGADRGQFISQRATTPVAPQ